MVCTARLMCEGAWSVGKRCSGDRVGGEMLSCGGGVRVRQQVYVCMSVCR